MSQMTLLSDAYGTEYYDDIEGIQKAIKKNTIYLQENGYTVGFRSGCAPIFTYYNPMTNKFLLMNNNGELVIPDDKSIKGLFADLARKKGIVPR